MSKLNKAVKDLISLVELEIENSRQCIERYEEGVKSHHSHLRTQQDLLEREKRHVVGLVLKLGSLVKLFKDYTQ